MADVIWMKLDRCVPDDRIQSRARLSSANVELLREKLRDKKELDPVVVFKSALEKRNWLAHGNHRWHAHKLEGKKEINVITQPGTMRDAILYSVGCNDKHCLPRTNEDIQHAVRMLLLDEEWSKWNDREIARHCKVGHATVSRHRLKLQEEQEDLSHRDRERERENSERAYTRSGTTSTMDVSNIGHGPIAGEQVVLMLAPDDIPGDLLRPDYPSIRAKLEAQIERAAPKFWRFAYRLARLDLAEGKGSVLSELLTARIAEWMDRSEAKERAAAKPQKKGA